MAVENLRFSERNFRKEKKTTENIPFGETQNYSILFQWRISILINKLMS